MGFGPDHDYNDDYSLVTVNPDQPDNGCPCSCKDKKTNKNSGEDAFIVVLMGVPILIVIIIMLFCGYIK